MTEPQLPPACTGVELRLDALIAGVNRLVVLLTPTPAEPELDPADGQQIELREPVAAELPNGSDVDLLVTEDKPSRRRR